MNFTTDLSNASTTTSQMVNFESPTNATVPRHNETTNQRSISTLLLASDVINKYMLPCSLLAGFVCNGLVMMLMRQPRIRATGFSIYMTVLAFSDSNILLSFLLFMWLDITFGINVRIYSELVCKICRYWAKVFIFCSSYMVCVIALERVLVIVAPFKSKKYISRKTAMFVSLGLFVFALVGMNPFIWMSALYKGRFCMVRPEYRTFDSVYGRWIDAVFLHYLPGVVVVICNAVLITEMIKIQKKRATMTSQTQVDRINFAPTAIVICFAYIGFSMPNSIFYVISIQKGWIFNLSPSLRFIQSLLNLIGSLNYSSNLLLYILSSTTMRLAFKEMICGCCKSSKPDRNSATKIKQDEAGKSTSMDNLSSP